MQCALPTTARLVGATCPAGSAPNIVQTGRLPLFCFFCAFVAGFGFIRLSVRLIRAQVRWWPGNVTSGDLHVHHMVFGVVFMLIGGVTGIVAPGGSLNWRSGAAALFGLGAALVLDEFALILHLRDVYWTSDGRLSVDAVFVAAGVTVLLLLGIGPKIMPGPQPAREYLGGDHLPLDQRPGHFHPGRDHAAQGEDMDGPARLVPVSAPHRGRHPAGPAWLARGPGGVTSAARISAPGRPAENGGSGSQSSGSHSASRTSCPACALIRRRIPHRMPRRTRARPPWAASPTTGSRPRPTRGPPPGSA